MGEINTFIPTNSLLAASFDSLKDDFSDPVITLDALSKVNMDECYFSSSIKIIKKMNEAFTNYKIAMYKTLSFAESNQMLLESFTDYYVQAESIISDAIKFLENKMESFFNTMEAFIAENKAIIEHKKALLEEIKHYQDDSRELHTFTIDNNTPNIGALENFNASLFEELFKPQITDFNAESISRTVGATELEEDYKRFRSNILNLADENISEQEFARALYRVFRNNNGMEDANITEVEIKNMAEVWFGFNEIKSSLKEDLNAIKNSYEAILKKISTISKNNSGLSIGAFTSLLPGDVGVEKIDGHDIDKSGAMMSSNMMLELDVYCKAKLDQLHKYTDIILMAMTAKMDAIKDMYMEYRACLYDAIEVLDNPTSYYDARK